MTTISKQEDKLIVPTAIARKKLPSRRTGYTQKVKINGQTIYMSTGEYKDGKLGEIFLDMHKEGAPFRSVLHAFAISVSIGLQYGVPLDEYVDAFVSYKFDPSGPVVGHSEVKVCNSLLDYIFRDLAINYLKRTDLSHTAKIEEII